MFRSSTLQENRTSAYFDSFFLPLIENAKTELDSPKNQLTHTLYKATQPPLRNLGGWFYYSMPFVIGYEGSGKELQVLAEMLSYYLGERAAGKTNAQVGEQIDLLKVEGSKMISSFKVRRNGVEDYVTLELFYD